MAELQGLRWSLHLHGAGAEVTCAVPSLELALQHMLGRFLTDQPQGGRIACGVIRPYDLEHVGRSVTPTARRISLDHPFVEMYEERERLWLLDERWGLAEVNLLKSQWRSWVLPQPRLDPLRAIEGAVLWPLAHLMKQKSLTLLPAPAVWRKGWGALLLAGFDLGEEVRQLINGGFKVIGQRWTAVREREGRVGLFAMPGAVEQFIPAPPGRRAAPTPVWVDMEAEFPGLARWRGSCDAVIVLERGRRGVGLVDYLAAQDGAALLKQSWPVLEISGGKRASAMQAVMAGKCRCVRIQLPRDPVGVVGLLNSVRVGTMGHAPLAQDWARSRYAAPRRPAA